MDSRAEPRQIECEHLSRKYAIERTLTPCGGAEAATPGRQRLIRRKTARASQQGPSSGSQVRVPELYVGTCGQANELRGRVARRVHRKDDRMTTPKP